MTKLNEKVYNTLLNQIHSGVYQVGDRIPTEKKLMETFSVSRSPVRDALLKLQNEGYIERSPRTGSVVRSSTRVNETINFKGGFSKYFGNYWDKITTSTIEVSTVLDEEVSSIFQQDYNDPLIKILRVRKFNKKPVFFLRTHDPQSLVKDVTEEEFQDINNLRDRIQQKTGITLKYSNETIEAVPADKIVSNNVDIEPGQSILKINRLTYDTNQKLVEYVEYYVNTSIWKYHIDYEY